MFGRRKAMSRLKRSLLHTLSLSLEDLDTILALSADSPRP